MANEIPIIDAHTHVHPTAAGFKEFMRLLAPQRAVENAGDLAEATGLMKRLGIRTSLILPWVFAQRVYAERLEAAGKPAGADDEALKDKIAAEWSAYNDWAIATAKSHPGQFGALCAIDPVLLGDKRTRAEIARCMPMGAIGLKVVPGFMNARPNDPRMAVVWEEANRREVSVTAQCSGSLEGTAHPSYFEDVLRSYPKARVVLAHMGLGGGEQVVAQLASKYPNVYCDSSSWLGQVNRATAGPVMPGSVSLTPQEAVELWRRIGTDRILYASNYPLSDSEEFVTKLKSLPLKDEEKRQIYFENAQRVHKGLGVGVAVA